MGELGFVPNHALVTAADASPARWMLMLHGILGSGANLRSLARRFAQARPAWGFVLVDLRMHGSSEGAPPPHTIAATAEDLLRLEDQLSLPIAGVLGHSFGGKVSLAYLERRRAARLSRGEPPAGLEQAWVLDASPSAEPERSRADAFRGRSRGSETTTEVIRMLRSIPKPLPSRERFFELVAESGFPRSIAEWLAMNVRRTDDGFRFRLDLDAIDALLADYFAADVWHVLEEPGFAEQIHVVIGGQSDALNEAERARLASIPRVHTHLIAEAGHWVHVDAPDALFELVSSALGP
jgi:pimeloyl-ACP methyl ester carboxylesterase